jgi:hypothetical protein
MKRAAIAAALAAFLCAALGAADFGGYVETRAGWYWGSSELVSPMYQLLEGGVSGKVGDAEAPRAQYLAKVDLEYDPTAGDSTTAATLRLGEAWIKIFEGPLDLSFGNQIVAWSISDGYWPSDVVNPWDYSLPMDPQRIPVPLGRVVLNGANYSIDLVAQPFWTESILPNPRWMPPSESALAALPHDTSLDAKPDFSWDSVGYGGHLKASFELLQGLDLGATYYRGKSSAPTGPGFTYSGMYPSGYYYLFDRSTLVGADLTLSPGGGILLKSEWGYTTLGDTDLLAPEDGKASAQGVSGFEYTIGTAQLEGEYVLDWTKGATEAFAHEAIGILTWSIDDRTEAKLAADYEFSGKGGFMLSPQGSYTIADGLKAGVEAYFFFGDKATIFGSYSGNDLATLSLKYSF